MNGHGYVEFEGSYQCLTCNSQFSSHAALTRHQFRSADPCVSWWDTLQPPAFESVPFEGELASVPTGGTSIGHLPDHRDALGRLRIRGALVGYRAWSIGRVDGTHRLFPVIRNDDVPYPRGVTTAVCDEGWPLGPEHPAPAIDCTCGIHAAWDHAELSRFSSTTGRGSLSGEVKGWGVVIPGELGWRSQYAMVEGVLDPACEEAGCGEPSTTGLIRPVWTRQLTPGGMTYPPPHSKRFAAYRETGDFKGDHVSSTYIGWFCDAHGHTEFAEVDPRWWIRCNFPTAARRSCKREAQLRIEGIPYSWCPEHAPILLDTAAVMRDLRQYYDLPDAAVA